MKIELPKLKLPEGLKLPERLTRGRKRPPEDSAELRAWVLAAVLVGEVAPCSRRGTSVP